ncbi:MAG: HAD family phosphatase [Beijerinckiaceae bacterium]|nr:HAD family phosphatase [Beijerinckiaceae bacterium]
MDRQIDCVIFDVGNVLVHWNPRTLYGKLIADEAELDRVLRDVVPMSWHTEFDAGKPFAVGVEERIRLFPDHADLIRIWDERWPEMFAGPIDGSVAILRRLKELKVPLFAITNYNRGKFDEDRKRFPFYDWFDDCVVSGDTGLTKPDPRIFRLLIDRNGIDPSRSLFIDDRLDNVEAAASLGLRTHQFSDPDALRETLAGLGMPV